jgi:hypothetical protein
MTVTNHAPSTAIQQAIDKLHQQREKALSLPAPDAMNFILDAPQPAALVHSISETDLLFLVLDIGPEDALPLLSLASNSQWEFILDMHIWKHDRIEYPTLTRWMNLRFLADPERFLQWVKQDAAEFVELYLFKNVHIRFLEPDEDPSDIPDDFMTVDSAIYYRLLPESEMQATTETFAENSAPEVDTNEERYSFITQFLNRLYSDDPIYFMNFMQETDTILPAEAEEETYRQHSVRMAEKGFLPFEEAVGVYQPITPEKMSRRYKAPHREDMAPPSASLYMSELLTSNDLLTNALKQLEQDLYLELQAEIASLANQIAVADQIRIESRDDLKAVVQKIIGYLGIGLELLSAPPIRPDRCAAVIQERLLADIFRVGYGAALELKWQAQQWVPRSWAASQKLPLNFWGEAWLGVLGGLLLKKPLYFDNYQTGVLYREFKSLADIQTTRTALNDIIQFDGILEAMPDTLSPALNQIRSKRGLFWKNLILTCWARWHLKLPATTFVLSMEQFIRFYRDLFDITSASDTDSGMKIPQTMKASFLKWLSAASQQSERELTDRCGQILESLFIEMEAEFSHVSPKNLDPRYISLFQVNA